MPPSNPGRDTIWGRSALPGRTFTGPADFNAQLSPWLKLVNTRTRRTLGCAPTDQIAADLERMLPLPPVAPATGWRSSTRLARDHYVRLDGNDYLVHPAVIGQRVEVLADLHRCGCSATAGSWPTTSGSGPPHQTISAAEHVTAAQALRAARIGLLRPAPATEEV